MWFVLEACFFLHLFVARVQRTLHLIWWALPTPSILVLEPPWRQSRVTSERFIKKACASSGELKLGRVTQTLPTHCIASRSRGRPLVGFHCTCCSGVDAALELDLLRLNVCRKYTVPQQHAADYTSSNIQAYVSLTII